MELSKIYIAIVGATSRFRGFGDFIASSKIFSQSTQNVDSLSKIDDSFKAYYNNLPNDYSDFTQFISFPVSIANTNCLLVIRAKKKFTSFPEQNRFYERREYFYCELESDVSGLDLVTSLPTMIQYEEKQLGQIEPFVINKFHSYSEDKIRNIISSFLLKGEELCIKIDSSSQNNIEAKILAALSTFPNSYKKYFGFGFSIKGDSPFIKSNLHIFTTLDDSGISLEGISEKISTDILSAEFQKSLLAGEILYDDTEIQLQNIPLDRHTISKLIEYHKLHFQIDRSFSSPVQTEKRKLISESKDYVNTFLKSTFSGNHYIIKRIIQIYRFWFSNGEISSEIFVSFWGNLVRQGFSPKLFYNENISEIKNSINEFIEFENRSVKLFSDLEFKFFALKELPSLKYQNVSLLDEMKIEYFKAKNNYDMREVKEIEEYEKIISKKTNINFQRNLFSKVDVKGQLKSLTKNEAYVMLKERFEALDEETISGIIKHIEFDNLYSYLGTEQENKFIRNNDFTSLVFELVNKQGNAETILKWVSLFKEKGVRVSFNPIQFINVFLPQFSSSNSFRGFEVFCDLIINYKNLFEANQVSSFIEIVQEKKNYGVEEFYSIAFRLARQFQFKINVPIVQINDNEQFFRFYCLVEEKQELLRDKKIVSEIAETFLDQYSKKDRSLDDVLKFVSHNGVFANRYLDRFITILNNRYIKVDDSVKIAFTVHLLKNIVKKETNLFLDGKSKLFLSIQKLQPTTPEFCQTINSIGARIEKKQIDNTNDVIHLINELVNRHFEQLSQNENIFTKMKNFISITNSRMLAICFSLIAVLILSIATGIYFFTQKESVSFELLQAINENSKLKDDIKQLNEKLIFVDSQKKQVASIASLSPLPKSELNANDVAIITRQNIRGKSLSEVVSIIFSKNNGDIATPYNTQRISYGQALVLANPDCFEDGVCICDELLHIPSYK